MKKKIMLLSGILICLTVSAQTGSFDLKAPVFSKHRGFLLSEISNMLTSYLPISDTSVEINALFFIRFNIDLNGNVCRVAFSNDAYTQKEGMDAEGIDSADRSVLNKMIEKVLLKTNGQWTPGQINNQPSENLPLLITVSCNVDTHGKPDKSSRRYGLLSRPNFGPLYNEDDNYFMFGTVQWSGHAVE